MPVPKEWPTLERINWFRFGDPFERPEPICDAAAWAVRVRPQLEALVEERHEYRDCSAGFILDKIEALIATPHEEHKETQG